MADESSENDLGLRLATENKRLAAELEQVRTRYESELTELAGKYTDLFTTHQETVKERDDLAGQGNASRATHADSFAQGVAYALQAARACPDLDALKVFLLAVLADARVLLVAIDRAESALASRLANGVPPQVSK